MNLYSIKMRASKNNSHVSGAERIIKQSAIAGTIGQLAERALHHGLGRADFINIKMEEVKEDELLHLDALPVSARPAKTPEESYTIMHGILLEMGLTDAESSRIIQLIRTVHPMRGAILYDLATRSCIEPDHERGIRVTYMDAEAESSGGSSKNHFREAIVLATKVVHAPGVLGEICISDDPDYVTGYISSLKHGYVRLTPLKEAGDRHGGRIFLFDSRKASAEEAIAFLEKQRVLVRGLPVEHPAEADPFSHIEKTLQQLKERNLYRSMHAIDSCQSKYVEMNGRRILLMASNSYLDLVADKEVRKAAATASLEWGAGSGGSRLTTGTTTLHAELERALARFKNTEAALLFNTGYTANVGTISALADKDSVIFSDEYNHASIIDGCRLSGAKIIVYKHNDMDDLESKLLSTPCQKGLIVSDAVFSMDGDIVDLPQLVSLGKKYHLLTMIDEAHATGVIGASGHGTAEHYGYSCQPDIVMGTLSKAFGAEGGFVCGSQVLIDYLVNKARSFIFSTSQCPATIGAALKAVEIVEAHPELTARLQHNVRFFCNRLREEGIHAASATPIIPIIIGDEGTALKVAADLLDAGVLIPAIRYPTVAKGTARLRVALMASHTEEELARTAKLIAQAIRKYQEA